MSMLCRDFLPVRLWGKFATTWFCAILLPHQNLQWGDLSLLYILNVSSASSPHADSNQGSSEATTILLPSGLTRPTSFMRNISADTKAPHHTSNGKTPLSEDPNYTLQCFRKHPWTRLSPRRCLGPRSIILDSPPQFHSPRSYLGHFCPHDRHKLLRRRSPPYRFVFDDLLCFPLQNHERLWKFDVKNDIGFNVMTQTASKAVSYIHVLHTTQLSHSRQRPSSPHLGHTAPTVVFPISRHPPKPPSILGGQGWCRHGSTSSSGNTSHTIGRHPALYHPSSNRRWDLINQPFQPCSNSTRHPIHHR